MTKTETLDGVAFEVSTFGFEEGIEVLDRLKNTIGPALGALVDGRGKLEPVLHAARSLTGKDLLAFAEVFGKVTRVHLSPTASPYLDKALRESLFAGKTLLFFRWLAFAIEVNYTGFFDGSGLALLGGGPAAPTPPPSPA